MSDTNIKDKTRIEQQKWQNKYEKQALLLNALLGLLKKYGTSLKLTRLCREFLLTIMGQFLARSACYYIFDDKTGGLKPFQNFGPPSLAALPLLKLNQNSLVYMEQSSYPAVLLSCPPFLKKNKSIKRLSGYYHLYAPLTLNKKLLGILFVGNKINNASFTAYDLELLDVFCEVSAITFNNARMYENAKLSIQEVQRLADIRIELIDRITHEFRTPLTVIKAGLLSLKVDAKFTQVLNWILKSVNRLEVLIHSMLELKNEDCENSLASGEEFHIGESIDRAAAEAARKACLKNISFEIRRPLNMNPPVLTITSKSFNSILHNLIDNAVEFSAPETSVVLEYESEPRLPCRNSDGVPIKNWKQATKTQLREFETLAGMENFSSAAPRDGSEGSSKSVFNETEKSAYWVLKISDTGIGIPQDELARISEPFSQASNSPNQGIKGKGLGLAVTEKLVAECGGLLYCRSIEGSGTTFTVFFPLK